MYSRMLVPIDDSTPSKLALQEAIKLAQALRAAICLVHVVDPRSIMTSEIEVMGAASESLVDTLRRDGERLLQDAAAIVTRAAIQVGTLMLEATDLPLGEYIVGNARNSAADLIICGTHGRHGMRRLLLGSTAEYVVRHTPVPVLLIRTSEAHSV